jgi:hypothetical protein
MFTINVSHVGHVCIANLADIFSNTTTNANASQQHVVGAAPLGGICHADIAMCTHATVQKDNWLFRAQFHAQKQCNPSSLASSRLKRNKSRVQVSTERKTTCESKVRKSNDNNDEVECAYLSEPLLDLRMTPSDLWTSREVRKCLLAAPALAPRLQSIQNVRHTEYTIVMDCEFHNPLTDNTVTLTMPLSTMIAVPLYEEMLDKAMAFRKS